MNTPPLNPTDDNPLPDVKTEAERIARKALSYYGDTVKNFAGALERDFFIYFSNKLLWAFDVTIKKLEVSVSFQWSGGTKYASVKSPGKVIGYYKYAKASDAWLMEAESSDFKLSSQKGVNPTFVLSSNGDEVAVPDQRVSFLQGKFGFRCEFAGDSISGRRDTQWKIRQIFAAILQVLHSQSEHICTFISGKQQKLDRKVLGSYFRSKAQREIQLAEMAQLIDEIQHPLLSKRLLFSNDVDGEGTFYSNRFSTFLLYRKTSDRGLYYLFSEDEKQDLNEKLTPIEREIIKGPIPETGAFCYALRDEPGAWKEAMNYIPDWWGFKTSGDNPDFKFDSFPEEVQNFILIEKKLLEKAAILIEEQHGFVVGLTFGNECRIKNPKDSKLNVHEMLKSFRRTIRNLAPKFQKLRQLIRDNEQAARFQDVRYQILGESDHTRESKWDLEVFAAHTADLIWKKYVNPLNYRKINKEATQSAHTPKRFSWELIIPKSAERNFHSLLLLGPVGSGKTQHAQVFRLMVLECLHEKLLLQMQSEPETHHHVLEILGKSHHQDLFIQAQVNNYLEVIGFGKSDFTSPNYDVNCAYLSSQHGDPNVAISTLFGRSEKSGVIGGEHIGILGKVAPGHILFLDEVGELDDQAQARLLQTIQDRTYRPLGGETQTFEGVFVFGTWHIENLRPDFWGRISDYPIELAPLKDRQKDCRILAEHFLADSALPQYLKNAILFQVCHPYYLWPGNIRQLKKVIECVCIRLEGRRTLFPDVPLGVEIVPSVFRRVYSALTGVEDKKNKAFDRDKIDPNTAEILEVIGLIREDPTREYTDIIKHELGVHLYPHLLERNSIDDNMKDLIQKCRSRKDGEVFMEYLSVSGYKESGGRRKKKK